MAAPDAAIQSYKAIAFVCMDGRVKPGQDNEGQWR